MHEVLHEDAVVALHLEHLGRERAAPLQRVIDAVLEALEQAVQGQGGLQPREVNAHARVRAEGEGHRPGQVGTLEVEGQRLTSHAVLLACGGIANGPREMIRAGDLMKITVVDHIILGRATIERPREMPLRAYSALSFIICSGPT